MTETNKEVCSRCSKPVTSIAIEVDGRDLVMTSCVNCDSRSWSLAGESIALSNALAEVGLHSGRRR